MGNTLRAIGAAALTAVLSLTLAGCGQKGPPWALKDISGLMPPLKFTLTDANTGRTVHAADFRGHLVLLYFGYTHCPDVCPTTLSRLSRAVASLGPRASDARILFVSVDPARDTLADLKRYAPAFGPEVVGLRGTQDALRALTKRYRVTYGYGKPDSDGNYEVSHSAAVYIFDRQGKARLLARPGDKAAAIGKDLARLDADR
ncbi:MAG TPA: SCO family protein [Gammaproteobacteria bacterium]|nr:SCO family protein [Gammaproteobacteria bacterium]